MCTRAPTRGARPMISPAATIIHYDGASNRDPVQKAIYTLQSTLGVIDLHMHGAERAIARASTIGGVALRRMATALAAGLGVKRFGSKADYWRSVWSRRDEWIAGPGAPSSESGGDRPATQPS